MNIWFGDESVILDHIVGLHSFPYFGADQLLCTGTPMNHFVICWSLFFHQTLTLYASSIQQEICGYTARSCGAFSTSLLNTSCTSCKNLWVNFSGFFSPSLISCSEMNSKLQQAQTNSQELQNGGCVSGVRRKRRGFWSHAMKEQLGVTLGGIKPWRRFVPGFIGETWLRRFENMWRCAHSVELDECQFHQVKHEA